VRDFDGFGRALVGVDTAEEQQVLAAVRVEGELLERNAMMDRIRVGQLRMPIGGADGDVGNAILITLEHR
jgi:hypothetical protein